MDETDTRYICTRNDGTLTCVHCVGAYAHEHEHGHCPVGCKRGHSSCEAMSAGELFLYMEWPDKEER